MSRKLQLEALLSIQQSAIHPHYHHSTGPGGKHATTKFSRTMNALPRNHQLLQMQGVERTVDNNPRARKMPAMTVPPVVPTSYGQPPAIAMVNQPYKAFGNASPVGKNSQLKTITNKAKEPNLRPKQLLGTSKGRLEVFFMSLLFSITYRVIRPLVGPVVLLEELILTILGAIQKMTKIHKVIQLIPWQSRSRWKESWKIQLTRNYRNCLLSRQR